MKTILRCTPSVSLLSTQLFLLKIFTGLSSNTCSLNPRPQPLRPDIPIMVFVGVKHRVTYLPWPLFFLHNREHLREATEMKEKDLNRVNLALRAYAAVGYGFDELADEYGTLMRDMENKEWALDELAKSN